MQNKLSKLDAILRVPTASLAAATIGLAGGLELAEYAIETYKAKEHLTEQVRSLENYSRALEEREDHLENYIRYSKVRAGELEVRLYESQEERKTGKEELLERLDKSLKDRLKNGTPVLAIDGVMGHLLTRAM